MSKFVIDKNEDIKNVFDPVMEKYFPELLNLKFLYVWRTKEKMDNGKIVVADVTKLSNKDRDIWGYDVRVEVDNNEWSEYLPKDRKKLAYHELLHIILIYEDDEQEDGEVTLKKKALKLDSDDRVCFSMKPHDISIERFRAELEKFGLSKEEREIRRFLNEVYEAKNQK